jgi:hypothetical protein
VVSIAVAPEAVPAPVVTPARPSTKLIERYVLTGRSLAAKRGIDVSDLWTKYRRIRIYEALRTNRQREETEAVLDEIQRELSNRTAVATLPE